MRIVYLATADARGHLMRAQLLTHALRENGADVKVLTTSDEGSRFLAEFGIDAPVLSRHYAVQFDAQQNMLRQATDANVAAYIFRPSRMLRDIFRLHPLIREADLIINDSFHPALLFMGCLPPWRNKIVHVYGASLRHALQTNFQGRLPKWLASLFGNIVSFQINRSRARLEHDFAYPEPVCCHNRNYRLPTPVAVVQSNAEHGDTEKKRVAIYLNPHFRDSALADALERGFASADVDLHLVGEGYAHRPGWLPHDQDWVRHAANSDLIVSAPGMAALSIAMVYQRPILLILTEQPEQQINAARAAELALPLHTVIWRNNPLEFAQAIHAACRQLLETATAKTSKEGHSRAAARLQTWVSVLATLARQH